jgi:hypothetical protein
VEKQEEKRLTQVSSCVQVSFSSLKSIAVPVLQLRLSVVRVEKSGKGASVLFFIYFFSCNQSVVEKKTILLDFILVSDLSLCRARARERAALTS